MYRILLPVLLIFVLSCTSSSYTDATKKKFVAVRQTILDSNWKSLPIGGLVAKIGLQFVNVPYVAKTLEGRGKEQCRVSMDGLDCVTLFETSLNMARIVHQGKDSLQDLIEAVTYTRYRDGVLTDFTSRLHYTSDWIDNNIKKGTVVDVTPQIGGKPFPLNVGFMSKNPSKYPALDTTPAFVTVMKDIEAQINKTSRTIIPKANVAAIEDQLQDGDIIAIATSKTGLDYSHTGLIVRDGKRARFLHASLVKKKVVFDGPISEYLSGTETNLGITVLRPLPVKR